MVDRRVVGTVSAAIDALRARGVATYGLMDLQEVLIEQFGLRPDEVSVPRIREALLHLEHSAAPASSPGTPPSTCSGTPPGFVLKPRN